MMSPKCKNIVLKSGKTPAKQLVLEQCSQCKGMWFDKGELTTLLGSRAKKYFEIPKFSVKVPDAECPRCNVSLYEFCYPGTLTLVDGCKQCDGVWLDNREWKAISHARDDSKKISCPKCHARQSPAESCRKCGIIIAKYRATEITNSTSQSATKKNLANNDVIEEQSYADDIPGIKGKLLRSIDSVVKDLSSSLGF